MFAAGAGGQVKGQAGDLGSGQEHAACSMEGRAPATGPGGSPLGPHTAPARERPAPQ